MIPTSLILAAADAAGRVGEGQIKGGWDFVWAAYLILWGALAIYGANLWRTHRNEVERGVES